MSKAIADVIAERSRQIEAEGWTPAHDDWHVDRSLARAAACYVEHYISRAGVFGVPCQWPESWAKEWWKPKTPRRDLVRAAALIIAEIERLDRAAMHQATCPKCNTTFALEGEPRGSYFCPECKAKGYAAPGVLAFAKNTDIRHECKADGGQCGIAAAEAYSKPPCQECGAMTPEEAETRCHCGGDKDDCHGTKLWPD